MIKSHLDNQANKKVQLLKLTVRILRQEAKKLSVPLYSRKNKALLVDFILKYQNKALIEDQTNNDRELYVDNNLNKVNSGGSKNIISDEDSKLKNLLSKSFPGSNLKRLLSKSFPDKKITITDNKDGSQTILIN